MASAPHRDIVPTQLVARRLMVVFANYTRGRDKSDRARG